MPEPDDIQTRFERRFSAIEAEIPARSFEAGRVRSSSRSRRATSSLAVSAAVLLVFALIVVPPMLRRSDSPAIIGGPSASVESSLIPRVIMTGELTWAVTCGATSDSDCDGAVELFANNLARSGQQIFDDSGGRLGVMPRDCPTRNGLTARRCWDVTAILPSGPLCMVVAHGATDPRYPAYFQIGGQDAAGRGGSPPDDWPLCLADR